MPRWLIECRNKSGSKLRALHTLSRNTITLKLAKRMECVRLAGAFSS